jgi:copper chaperone CopZ
MKHLISSIAISLLMAVSVYATTGWVHGRTIETITVKTVDGVDKVSVQLAPKTGEFYNDIEFTIDGSAKVDYWMALLMSCINNNSRLISATLEVEAGGIVGVVTVLTLD